VVGMFLNVIFRNAKVFLAASAVLFVAFNVFAIARHLGGAMVLVRHADADGLFAGMLIASLVLLRLDQRQDQHLNAESAMARRQPKRNLRCCKQVTRFDRWSLSSIAIIDGIRSPMQSG
jgi:hypothetical protein